MAQTMAEHLIEKGIERGNQPAVQLVLKLAIEEGIELGRIEAKQASILKVLRLRFDAVPESLADEINSIRNFPRLDELLEKAVTAETLDEIDLHNHEN
ncbi:MAG: hypothetical protein OXT74_05515 [Candidatus Poribacteria bacterium]|nr:hypothetical protein [Candidatus Poribacteria bacterium]